MQIVNGYEYKEKAQQVALRSVAIPAQRGEIFDRHFDTPLVTNIDSFAIDLVPAEVPDGELNTVIKQLANVIHVDPEEMIKKIP